VSHQLPLPAILTSLQILLPLEPHVGRIAKKLHTRFVHSFLTSASSPQPLAFVVVEDELRLTAIPTSQNPTDGLSTLCAFVRDHILSSSLPDTIASLFQRLFYPPLLQALIDLHLRPSLPSSLDGLGLYMTVLSRAEAFESSLDWSPEARPVKEWADGVAAHWARERADKAAGTTRRELMGWGDWASETVEYPGSDEAWIVQPEPEPEPGSRNENGDAHKAAGAGSDQVHEEPEEDGWGFEESEAPGPEAQNAEAGIDGAEAGYKEEEEGWGFDEEGSQDAEIESEAVASSSSKPDNAPSAGHEGKHRQADSMSGWAWDQDDESAQEVPQTRKSALKGKRRSLDGDGGSKEKFSVSAKARALLKLAEEVLDDSLRASDPR
jgi:hypothetical protein